MSYYDDTRITVRATSRLGRVFVLEEPKATQAILDLHGGGYTTEQTMNAMESRRRLIEDGETTIDGVRLELLRNRK